MAEDAGRHRQVVEGTEVGLHDVDVQRVLDRTRTSRTSGANGWRLPPGLMWKCTRKGWGVWVAPWSTLREGSIVEYMRAPSFDGRRRPGSSSGAWIFARSPKSKTLQSLAGYALPTSRKRRGGGSSTMRRRERRQTVSIGRLWKSVNRQVHLPGSWCG